MFFKRMKKNFRVHKANRGGWESKRLYLISCGAHIGGGYSTKLRSGGIWI